MTAKNILREKSSAALSSVVAAVFLTGLKLFVGVKTNSLGILSEAAHSALDLVAALVTLFAVRVSDKPPDEDHQYGHGKVENVSALIETILLVLTCGWILFEAVKRLFWSNEVHVEVSVYSFAVMIFAIVVDIGRSRVLSKAAKKFNSQALEADALHFSSDVWTSTVVIFGLGCVWLGYPILDPIAAIAVALLVLFVSYRLGRRTIDELTDRVPAGLTDRVRAVIVAISGVEKLTALRLRSSGARVFVEASVSIRRTTPFSLASDIVHQVEDAIRETHNNVDVTVNARPVETDDESLADKIRMLVLKNGLRAPHNLEIHKSDEKLYIDFDVEFPGGHSFEDAHHTTTDIENDIRKIIPDAAAITIHIEEYQPEEADARPITPAEESLRDAIRRVVLEDVDAVDCPDVRLLRTGDGYNISLTCGIDKLHTITRIHQVATRIENELYRQVEHLHKVTIHTEPR